MGIAILKKNNRKINIVVMDPVVFYRQSMVQVLSKYFVERINVTDVVSSLSALMCLALRKGPADVYLMEAFGQNESYNNWGEFTHFMATYHPSVKCLLWSSKPTMFINKFNNFERGEAGWQIPKKIDISCFVSFLTRFFDGENFASYNSQFYIGPPMSNLTPSEIAIITGIIEGDSIKCLAKKFNVAYKTISTHKRNAMIKMRISSTAQLRSLFLDGHILRGGKERYLPIETSSNQPFML
ncbi:TPA: response regulator transcription factor [Serratia marcescens]|nr:response regulator transcription factor [Serratia marcescens]